MSLLSVLDISSTGMSSQAIRLNTVASNIANAQNISGSADEAYKARHPVFKTMKPNFTEAFNPIYNKQGTGVEVTNILESDKPARQEYRPGHPLADDKGYVYLPNVNSIEEMTDMISASRTYQTNVNLFDTAKQQILQTLNLMN